MKHPLLKPAAMKIQIPWYGKATGSSAKTIYQSYWGNTYTRCFPFSFHYPDTPKQAACQASFFDIQRIWIPCYEKITQYINTMQRKNKNPFNILSSSVYHIFNPYNLKKKQRKPKYFGLDAQNRVYANMTNVVLQLGKSDWELTFNQNRPHIDINAPFNMMHVLLFNTTKTSMYYKITPWDGTLERVVIANTNDWQSDDTIEIYVALSASSWLGNFNRVVQ